jgi:hypothetical protein
MRLPLDVRPNFYESCVKCVILARDCTRNEKRKIHVS